MSVCHTRRVAQPAQFTKHDRMFSDPIPNTRFLTCRLLTRSLHPILVILGERRRSKDFKIRTSALRRPVSQTYNRTEYIVVHDLLTSAKYPGRATIFSLTHTARALGLLVFTPNTMLLSRGRWQSVQRRPTQNKACCSRMLRELVSCCAALSSLEPFITTEIKLLPRQLLQPLFPSLFVVLHSPDEVFQRRHPFGIILLPFMLGLDGQTLESRLQISKPTLDWVTE